jgi:peroxiredoxin
MMHDTSMSRQDARFIKTMFLTCGLNPKNDSANAILEHLQKLARPFPLLQPGDAVPDFQFTDVDGKTSKLKDLQGKIVIIHFWATDCLPCMAQMGALCARLRKLPADKVDILLVSLDFDLEAFEAVRGMLSLPCRHICDTKTTRGTIPETFGINQIPIDVVIDADGKIAAYDLNAVSDAGELKAIESRTKR